MLVYHVPDDLEPEAWMCECRACVNEESTFLSDLQSGLFAAYLGSVQGNVSWVLIQYKDGVLSVYEIPLWR